MNVSLGAIPLGLQFAGRVAIWMIQRRLDAAAAAELAAAEFEYFQRVSEAPLWEIAYEMERNFPEYPYWQWFNILRKLQKYGISQRPPEPTPPPEERKAAMGTGWLLAGVALLAILLMSRR